MPNTKAGTTPFESPIATPIFGDQISTITAGARYPPKTRHAEENGAERQPNLMGFYYFPTACQEGLPVRHDFVTG